MSRKAHETHSSGSFSDSKRQKSGARSATLFRAFTDGVQSEFEVIVTIPFFVDNHARFLSDTK
jgi:hypothetical protein